MGSSNWDASATTCWPCPGLDSPSWNYHTMAGQGLCFKAVVLTSYCSGFRSEKWTARDNQDLRLPRHCLCSCKQTTNVCDMHYMKRSKEHELSAPDKSSSTAELGSLGAAWPWAYYAASLGCEGECQHLPYMVVRMRKCVTSWTLILASTH